MNRRISAFIILLALFLIFTSITSYFWPLQNPFLFPIIPRYNRGNISAGCKIPILSPWHESLKGIQHPRQTYCRQIQPNFTNVNDHGIMHLDIDAIRRFEIDQKRSLKSISRPSVICQYAYFDRGHIDREIIFENALPLVESVKLVKNFVRVSCNMSYEVNNASSTKLVYTNLHAHPIPIYQNQTYASEDDLNVFLYFLESTSASMFKRHLPSAFQYLAQTMSAFVFESTSKVGENTLPNLAALFTGLRLRNEQADMRSELKSAKNGFYDHWPFVWKKYAEKGYSTAFVEDYTHLAIFHYNAKGFETKPVDYWYFPFWEALRFIELPEKSSKFCFGNQPIHEVFNDILRRHMISDQWMNDRQFIFSIFNELSHDYSFDLERMDENFKAFLSRMHEIGKLNRTLLIIAGDHGPRFTSVRSSEAGFVEERIPFFAVILPSWFLEKYPRAHRSLKLNQNRLTTMFDLHATLIDLLEQRFTDDSESMANGRGLSLFHELPLNRTCVNAGVPDSYCLCQGITIESIDHPLANRSASFVLKAIWNVTKIYRMACSKLRIDKILYFVRIGRNDIEPVKKYFVAFTTLPMGGMFEGAVIYDSIDQSIVFQHGTLERINSFNGAHCVTGIHLKKFCVCKRQPHRN